jgi:hypothetical protein
MKNTKTFNDESEFQKFSREWNEEVIVLDCGCEGTRGYACAVSCNNCGNMACPECDDNVQGVCQSCRDAEADSQL